MSIPSSQPTAPDAGRASPFLLGDVRRYREWRAAKLDAYPRRADDLRVTVADPQRLTPGEKTRMTACCVAANMVIYATAGGGLTSKAIARDLGAQFGLTDLDHNPLADEDSVSALQVVPGKSGRGYIPYSNQRLLWHTDGYYNSPERRIRSFLLHCVRPAAEGGDNALLDHEIAYLLLRDINPAYVEALMHPQAMTIPPNTEDAGQNRAAQTGPVFAIDPLTGALHMRYTARTRSIVWRDDAVTKAAVACLADLLAQDNPYVVHYRLRAGEGLLCNNVLHNRTGFNDAPAIPNPTSLPLAGEGTGAESVVETAGRLMYRARYYNRVAGT